MLTQVSHLQTISSSCHRQRCRIRSTGTCTVAGTYAVHLDCNTSSSRTNPMVTAIFAKLRASAASATPAQPSLLEQIVHELSLYTLSPATEHSACPLTWWAANKATYPNVARLARKLLAMPATSGTSERLFSKAGDVITKKRNRIDACKADKIIFLDVINVMCNMQ